MRLERNNDYLPRKPYLEAIEFSPFYTPEEFLEEKVDIIPYTSDALAGRDIQVLEGETFTTAFLMMSCHLAPLDKPAVRRAISMAIDKKEIAKAAFRMDTNPHVTDNFIPPRLPGFYPAETKAGHQPGGGEEDPGSRKGFSGDALFSPAHPLPPGGREGR